MNNWIPSTEFEEKVKKSYQIPEVRQEFVQALQLRLEAKEPSKPGKSLSRRKLSPAWVVGMFLLTLSLLVTLVVGPQEVWAAIGRLFGYIPGVGLVDDDQEFRVLAEPVSQTRDGLTITVTNALVTENKTVVLFSIDSVAWESLSHEENVLGCFSAPELRLPDGENLSIRLGGGGMGNYRFEYPPIDKGMEEAIFFLACIPETLPGLAPENWELPLRFVPAPDDLDVIPVFEIPLPTATLEAAPENEPQPLSIVQALEIGDTYTLFVEFAQSKLGGVSSTDKYWQLIEPPALTDGNNAAVFYQFPDDLELPTPSTPGDQVFAFQFSKTITLPLNITFKSEEVSKKGTPYDFTFTFDAGANPRPGQEWLINLPLILDGYEAVLTSVVAGENGFSFQYIQDVSSDMNSRRMHNLTIEKISIDGFTALGGGGGGGGGHSDTSIRSRSLIYESIPTGNLTVNLEAQLYQSSEPQFWTLEWAPESMSNSLFGIQPVVDRWLEDPEGYILIGHTEWSDDRIANVAEYGNIRALSADGRELQFVKLTFTETLSLIDDLQPNQWVYRLVEKDISKPVTLRLEKVNAEFAEPVRFTLDLRTYGFSFSDALTGLPWKMGLQPLNIPGISANLFRVTYIEESSFSGFEFEILGDSRLKSLALDFDSILNGETQARKHRVNINQTNGALVITVLANGQLSMPLDMVAHGADISGSWEGIFSPEN